MHHIDVGGSSIETTKYPTASALAAAAAALPVDGQILIENDGAIFRGSSVSFPSEVWDLANQKWTAYTGTVPKGVAWGNVISAIDAACYMTK